MHTLVCTHVYTCMCVPVCGPCPLAALTPDLNPPHWAARSVGRPPASAASSRISRGCASPRRLDEFCCGSGPRPLFQFTHLTNQCARGWWVEAGSVFKIWKTDVLHKQIGASGRRGGEDAGSRDPRVASDAACAGAAVPLAVTGGKSRPWGSFPRERAGRRV